ncbi:MAG: helix-turn-helix domain-containing protein [Parasporobacterium sp.]|nr:helix-turn-helix domain-containing protein [Parasporobacterium sp.]
MKTESRPLYLINEINRLRPLNEFETILKYLYVNKIPYDNVDYDSLEFNRLLRAEKGLTAEETKNKFIAIISSFPNNNYIPTRYFVPEGRTVYIRKFPIYMPSMVHIHKDALEINIVLEGNFYQYINGGRIAMKPGDICFIAPCTPHDTFNPDENTIVLSVLVYQDVLRNILRELKSEDNDFWNFFHKTLFGSRYYPFLLCHTGFDVDILGLALDLEYNQHNNNKYTDSFTECGLKLMILKLLMRHSDSITLGSNIEKNESEIMNLMEFIQDNLTTVSLESISKTYNYSISYLSTLIKEQYGKSFTEITTELRLERAKILLKKTNLSMSRIAAAVGYSDKSYFLKRFKKQFGITPSEYRKTCE